MDNFSNRSREARVTETSSLVWLTLRFLSRETRVTETEIKLLGEAIAQSAEFLSGSGVELEPPEVLFLARIAPFIHDPRTTLLDVEEEWEIFWVEAQESGQAVSPSLPSTLRQALIEKGMAEIG
jgi:hypothetical protein